MARALAVCVLDDLTIDDEAAVSRVPLYAELKAVVRGARLPFRVLPEGSRWGDALLVNLTSWSDGNGDVLVRRHIAADVVTHVAWHELAARALVRARARPSAHALLLGEAIASAFDLYLVGMLLRQRARSTFLESHVAAMAEAAKDAGLGSRGFSKLLASVAADPAGSFAALRSLLFSVSSGLLAAHGVDEASAFLTARAAREHRFSPLLHQYALATWVLYARAFGTRSRATTHVVRTVDHALRARPSDALSWLTRHWLAPRLARANEREGGSGSRRARSPSRSLSSARSRRTASS